MKYPISEAGVGGAVFGPCSKPFPDFEQGGIGDVRAGLRHLVQPPFPLEPQFHY